MHITLSFLLGLRDPYVPLCHQKALSIDSLGFIKGFFDSMKTLRLKKVQSCRPSRHLFPL